MLSNAPKGLLKASMKALNLRDPEAFEVERLTICKVNCPKRRFCPLCHCLLTAKVSVKEEKCPKNLWQSL